MGRVLRERDQQDRGCWSWGAEAGTGESACTVLLGGEARGCTGAGAWVTIAGPVPLRPGGRPGAAWGGGFGWPGQHPGPLQCHGVVRRLPGRVWVGLGEVGDRDAHVAWWGGRRLPVAALLPGCCGREKALQLASREAHPGPHTLI